MKKFLAVVKREYVQRVRSKMFVIVTLGAPLMFALFTIVPVLIATIRAGGPVRFAVVDETGRMFERVSDAIATRRAGDDDGGDEGDARENPAASVNQSNARRAEQAGRILAQGYEVERVEVGGRPREEIKRELDERVKADKLDAYLILPKDILESGEALYYSRNVGDVFTRVQVRESLTRAVRDERLAARDINPEVMRAVNQPVRMTARAAGGGREEVDRGQGFYLVFGVGFIIYLSILMYGQVILGAIIEEKETRVAEILFSSVGSFHLMMGKLIGVSLVALTQFAIWGLAIAGFTLYTAARVADAGGGSGFSFSVPPSVYVYLVLFFLLGYFIYAALYALVGSMVTTAQEGGQLAMPIILILVVAFYLVFPVLRSPNSDFAFWVSMIPLFSPITMLVRVVTQTPPAWQIALSLAIGFATVALFIWLAARVYRVGMLMYGKRATIPEVLKWIRQP